MKKHHQQVQPQLWRRLLQAFGQDLWGHRRLLGQSYLLSLIAVATTVLLPWPLKIIIDHGLTYEPLPLSLQWINPWNHADALVAVMTIAFVVITVIYAISGSWGKILEARVREGLGLGLRDRLLAHLQNLPPIPKSGESRGDLLLRLISDVSVLARFQTKTLPLIFRHSATAIIILVIMLWLNPLLALVGVSLLPVFGAFVWHYSTRLDKASRQKRSKEGEVAGLAHEIVHGLSTIKGLGQEQPIRERFGTSNAESLKAGVHATKTAVGMERILQIAQGVTIALITGGGALLVIRGRLSIGELTVFASYMTQLLKPIEKINELATAVSRGLVSGDRLLSILDRCPLVQDSPNALTLQNVQGVVDLSQVSFTYPTPHGERSEPALQNVTFSLKPGRLSVLIGESGSGKSTILSLLARFFDPSSGEIRLDGHPFPHIAVQSLRSQITLMLQDIHLFAGTIRMALTPPHLSEVPQNALWQALTLVHLEHFVQALPLGLDTPIGENAINFSGGQRRRLSLARAFLLNRPILLLDEPLANVDEESEAVILEALDQIRVGRTCLVSTHTPSLIQRADDLFYLKDGQITQESHVRDFTSTEFLKRNL